MSSLGTKATIPAGRHGMIAHENRLISVPGELANASGVSFRKDLIAREAGARLYDANGIGSGAEVTATLASSVEWFCVAATFTAVVTSRNFYQGVAYITNPSLGLFNSSQTQDLLLASGNIGIGDMAVHMVGVRTFVPPVSPSWSMTDTQGNTYRFIGFQNSVSGSAPGTFFGIVGFYSILTTALTGGTDSVTIDFSDAGTPGASLFFPTGWTTARHSGLFTDPADDVAGSSGTGIVVRSGAMSTSAVTPFVVGGVGTNPRLIPTDITFGGGAVRRVSAENVHQSDEEVTTPLGVLASFQWDAQAVNSSPGGTVTTTDGSTNVTGSGTTFTSFAPGDTIVVGGEGRIIETINSTTDLDTVDAFLTSNVGAAYTIRIGERIVSVSTSGELLQEKPVTLTTGDLDDTSLLTGRVRATRPPYFVVGGREAAAQNRKLFIFDGVNPVAVVDGNTGVAAAITAPPLDWGSSADANTQPRGGTIHRNALAGFGNLSDPHRIYFSDPDDHEDFTTIPNSIRVRSDIGKAIASVASFNGLLFIGKYPRGLFWLDDTDLDSLNWVIQTKSELLGVAPSPYSMLPIEDDILFMAPDGNIHLLSAVDALGGVKSSNLTYNLGLRTWTKDNVNTAALQNMSSYYNPTEQVAYFAVPQVGSSFTPSLVLKLDFSQVAFGGPIRFSYTTRDVPGLVTAYRTLDQESEVRMWSELGDLFIESEAFNKDGASYTTSYELSEMSFAESSPGLAHQRKIYDDLYFVFNPTSNPATLTVQVFVDGVQKQVLSVPTSKRVHHTHLSCGDGYTIAFRVTNTELDKSFEVIGHALVVRVGNEDTSR